MKTLIVLSLCLVPFLCSAQKINASKVPASVKATLVKMFPRAIPARWEKEDGNYEASFSDAHAKLTVLFDHAGVVKEIERDIPTTKLPSKVIGYMAEHFKGHKIKEASEIQLPDGTLNYEAEANGLDVIFDHDGNFLKSQHAH